MGGWYGWRRPGSLTAADPGDTIIFDWASYNDSGASVAPTGVAVTDIEVFRAGVATARATDSGYALISDTGQYGNSIGMNRVSVQLFNTADDTGFFDSSGDMYSAWLDSVTIDSRTVRVFLGSFNIGPQDANVTALEDTGINNRTARILAEVDTGIRSHVTQQTTDTGLRFLMDDYDTGNKDRLGKILADTDTGIPNLQAIIDGIWDEADTGHRDAASMGFHQQNQDTGGHRVSVIETDVITAAAIAANAITATEIADGAITAAKIATDAITADKIAADAIGASELAADAVNEIVDGVWDEADTGHRDANTMGWHQENSDTGTDDRLAKIQADTDTGIGDAPTVAQIVDAIWDETDTGHRDTGTYGRLVIRQGRIRDKLDELDTGQSDRLAKILADTDTGINVPTAYDNADALLNFDLAEATDSGTEARRTVLQAMRFNRNRVEWDTGGFTVYKENDSTTSHTGTLERDTGAAPIKTVNPT